MNKSGRNRLVNLRKSLCNPHVTFKPCSQLPGDRSRASLPQCSDPFQWSVMGSLVASDQTGHKISNACHVQHKYWPHSLSTNRRTIRAQTAVGTVNICFLKLAYDVCYVDISSKHLRTHEYTLLDLFSQTFKGLQWPYA